MEFLLRWVERHPDDGGAYQHLYWAYLLKGMHRETIQALERSETLFGLPEVAAHIERAFSTSGYRAAMLRYAWELEHLAATKQAFLPATTAEVYAMLGDKDRAFYWLEQGYRHRELTGYEPSIVFIKVDPMLDPLRSDLRLKDLVRRMGLPP